MNIYLIFSAFLIIIVALLHSILGEILIIKPTLKLGLPKIYENDFLTKKTLRFAWHLTTLLWFGLATILFYFSAHSLNSDNKFVVKTISVVYFIGAFISLIVARGRHFSWWAFLIISILTWIGSL